MDLSNELTVAIEAVRKASMVCRSITQTSVKVSSVEKADRSPVSIADLASQVIITFHLLENFPLDPIVGEEEAETLHQHKHLIQKVMELVGKHTPITQFEVLFKYLNYASRPFDPAKRFWTVDPIDGTKGFLRGDQYAVALALLDQGQVILGVLGCPNMSIDPKESNNSGALFYAVKNSGTFMIPMNGNQARKVSVDSITDVRLARFCESVEKNHASHDQHQKIARALGIIASPCRIDSQVKYAALAKGDASIYFRLPRTLEYREKIWDHAAGSIIVEEAGGKVTDFKGKLLQFNLGKKLDNNIGILATNKLLHHQVLDAIADST